MRTSTRSLLILLLALPAGAALADAQERIPIVPPGALVQITMTTGERVIAPLAELRRDSLYLSTTKDRPERALAMSDIRRIAYQDGKVFHGRIGALIGIGAGLATAQLAGRKEGAFRTQDGRNVMMLLGAGVGGFVGLAYGSPRWVVAYGDVAQRPTRQGMPTLALRMRFLRSGAGVRGAPDAVASTFTWPRCPALIPPDRLIVRLRDARTAVGLTQAELAGLVGVSRKTINTVENGVFVPSTVLALRIGRALDLTVEALFGLPDDTIRERHV